MKITMVYCIRGVRYCDCHTDFRYVFDTDNYPYIEIRIIPKYRYTEIPAILITLNTENTWYRKISIYRNTE